MSSTDLHPEELFDKASAGTLTASEHTFFRAHLAQCAVCRFEHQVRADFMAAPVPEHDIDDLVTRALSGMPAQPPARAVSGRSGRRALSMIAAAAVMMTTMASFAAVARWTGLWPRVFEASFEPAPAVAPMPRRGGARVPAEPVLPMDEAPAPIEPVPSPTVADDERPRARLAVPRPVEAMVQPERLQTPPIPAPEPERALLPPPSVMAPPDAGGLFATANDARVRKDVAGAVRLYRALLSQFPQAPEARLTQATLGRLLLDTGDAQGALEQLDGYLAAGDSTLREEALVARARSLSALGRTTEEAAAWSALVQGFPDSIHADRARARLQELGGR